MGGNGENLASSTIHYLFNINCHQPSPLLNTSPPSRAEELGGEEKRFAMLLMVNSSEVSKANQELWNLVSLQWHNLEKLMRFFLPFKMWSNKCLYVTKFLWSPYHLSFSLQVVVFVLLLLKKLAVCPGISNTLDFADCIPVMLFNGFLCYCKL